MEQFIFLTPDKFKYGALSKLFKVRQYTESGYPYRDVLCMGCSKIRKKAKAEKQLEHGLSCSQLLEYDEEAVQELLEQSKLNSAAKKNSIVLSKERMDAECNKIVDFIAVNCLPLSTVETPEFKALFDDKIFAFKLPGRWRLTHSLLCSRASWFLFKSLKELKDCADHTITIEFDGWKSSNGLSVLGILATNIYGASTLLDLIDTSSESETAEYLSQSIMNTIQHLDIPSKKINALVTDQGSAYKRARKMITYETGFERVLEYRCMAHVLNLIGSTMSRDRAISEVLTKLSVFISKICQHKILLDELKKLGEKRVLHIAPTRWYSTSSAINSILAIRTSLGRVPKTSACGYAKWENIYNDTEFWSNIEHLSPYFDRLSSMIGQVESSESKLSDSFRCILDLGHFLLREIDKEDRYRDAAISSFLTHFCRLDQRLLLSAYALDPNYKLEYLKPKAIKEVGVFLLAMLTPTVPILQLKELVMIDLANYRNLLSNKDLPIIKDTYAWWMTSKFETIKRVAMRLSASHASSANTERMFSGLTRILTSSRNRLNLKTVFELMVIRTAKLSGRSQEKTARREMSQSLTSSQRLPSQSTSIPSSQQEEPECFIDDSIEVPEAQSLNSMLESVEEEEDEEEDDCPIDLSFQDKIRKFEDLICYNVGPVQPSQDDSANLSRSSCSSRRESEALASILFADD